MNLRSALKPLFLIGLLALLVLTAVWWQAAPEQPFVRSARALWLSATLVLILLAYGVLAGLRLRGGGQCPELEALTLPPESGPAPLGPLDSARAEHAALLEQMQSLQQELARETERLRDRRGAPA